MPRTKKTTQSLSAHPMPVNKERSAKYGHPLDDFSRTAAMMTGLGFRFIGGATGELRSITPEDFAMLMVLVKLSRQSHAHQDDNVLDIQGYANCIPLIRAERSRRK